MPITLLTNTAKCEEDGKEVVLPLTTFLDGIATEKADILLPRGCIHFRRERENSIFIIEQPPTIRRLKWQFTQEQLKRRDVGRKAGEYRDVSLAMPYVVFCLYFTGSQFQVAHVFFRNAPVESLDDELSVAPLPNVDATSRICTGTNPNAGVPEPLIQTPNGPRVKYDHSPAERDVLVLKRLNYFFGTFWQTSFNWDMLQGSAYAIQFSLLNSTTEPHYSIGQIRDVLSWAELTAQNPSAILEVPWPTGHAYTVRRWSNFLSQYRSVPGLPGTDWGHASLVTFILNNATNEKEMKEQLQQITKKAEQDRKDAEAKKLQEWMNRRLVIDDLAKSLEQARSLRLAEERYRTWFEDRW